MIGVKEMIAVRKINSERPLMQEKWCQDQVNDFQWIVNSIEELIASAVASANSPHQYTILRESKEKFINDFMDMCEKYRVLADK